MANIVKFKTHRDIVVRLRDDLRTNNFILLYAYNGTGKTRLSMEFKEYSKRHRRSPGADTLYFNAYTEDLFSWDNDLDNDKERVLLINDKSKFFEGLNELSLDVKIREYLNRYADFGFTIDLEGKKDKDGKTIEKKNISFYKEVIVEERDKQGKITPKSTIIENIKISRGEENIFIWCFFLAICDLAIAEDVSYKWVKYIYIDDPISSLDDNNAIAVASDLSKLLKGEKNKLKVVISSHHALFFNVMSNELKNSGSSKYFLHKNENNEFRLQSTDETPFFHHVAMLSELNRVKESGEIYTYHFNMLRSILEKTATFFGHDDFSKCIHGVKDEVLYARALNLLSHGKYSMYEPQKMNNENKTLFVNILKAFLTKYNFHLPEIFAEKDLVKEETV